MAELPDFLRNAPKRPRVSNRLADNLGQGAPPYVSIMGNKFTLISSAGAQEPVATYDPKLGPYLDCCLIDVNEHLSKIYYDHPFDPSSQQFSPPTCWSDNGLAPSRNASQPQSPTCATCEKGAWGSATSKVTGKGVKACQDYQKVALLIPGDDVTFLLRVPPNSLRNLRDYTKRFDNQQVDTADVITRITFQQGVLGTLAFQAVNYVDEATYKQREAVLLAKGTDALVGRTDQPHPMSGLLPAPPTPVAISGTAGGGQMTMTTTLPLPSPAVTAPPPSVSAPAISPSPAQSPPPAGPLAGSGPAPTAPKPRGRPRRNAAPEAGNGQQAAPPFPVGEIKPADPSFGIQQGAAPNPEMKAMIEGIFDNQK